ncbi:MAG: ATP-binding protein [Sulfuricurvum sp.]|uniref:AAA family ATPase n=1 Tax=Sulfuricurvum sp. TaxID=2025608 RepID=UPI0025D9F2E4|nr:ATP-binding protein [Sulfuricurvum sp.]MCK9373672.1 ATP-binding protein [Sulfuricurvum sp.]
MLVEFKVNNFRSIKDTATFSMLTSSKDEENYFPVRDYNLLRSSIVYGANASGKSNLLRAMAFMGRLVLNRYKIMQSTDLLPHDPYRLSIETENESSTFEIVFFIDEIKYRYGFETDSEVVYSEWLFADEKGKEAKLFFRDSEESSYVNPNKFKEGYDFFNKKDEKIKIAKNQLFIWKCDQSDGEISKAILGWFNQFNMIDGMDHNGYINFTMKKMEDEVFRKKIIDLVKTADIGIDDIQIDEEEMSVDVINGLPFTDAFKTELFNKGAMKSISLNTIHQKFDQDGEVVGNVVFELNEDESKGTKKFFAMSAPILDTLQHGKILIIDELDASLHPILTQHLIKLFHDEKINKEKAQLIFATHDTNLLKPELFRRDQIWLTEKDQYGATNIYSLAQFKNVRKQEDFEKQYIQGKYGAIPYLGKFEF